MAKKAMQAPVLALRLSKKTVEHLGGRAGVKSQLKQGSRFWIELPEPILERGENHTGKP